MIKKITLALMALCLMCLLPVCADAYTDEYGYTHPDPFDAYPPMEGHFLSPEAENAEFVYADHNADFWLYISPTLHVRIECVRGKVNGRKTVWYESELWLAEGTRLQSFSANPENKRKGNLRPEYIAQIHRVVYAQNGDYFTYRVARDKTPGIIIRDGEILYDKTYRKRISGTPALDQMAIFEDGSILLQSPGQTTAAEYIERGARDVFSFGPILIADGVIDERLTAKKNPFSSLEPRSAIGIIEAGHYIGIYVEGRNDRSAGAKLSFVAERLLARGCVHAYNLDGGQTAAMVFMGEVIHGTGNYNGFTNTRSQPDIIGVGISDAVQVYVPRK